MRAAAIFLALLLSSCSAHTAFERQVVERAYADPASAEEYFLRQIEKGATCDQQSVYMYGMGLAAEKRGDYKEARDDFLSAQISGYDRAQYALHRVSKRMEQ